MPSSRIRGGALLALAGCAALSAAAAAPTADEIIARNVAARGGAERLRALGNLRRSGHLVIPGYNVEMSIVEVQGKGGELRTELTFQGLTRIVAYDGHEAWRVQPFQGRKDPARMSEDEAKALALGADVAGPFVDYRAKGNTVEYLGLEDVDGTPAHKLRVGLKSGDEATFWIDPDTWMVIRELDRQSLRGTEDLTEIDYGEYEPVGGVYVPMLVEEGAKDSDAVHKQKTVFDKAEADVALPPGFFSFPEPPAPRRVSEARP